MDSLWIVFAVGAALMQAIRTAAQKTLNQRMSNLATTYVRSLFGLPVMMAYLAAVLAINGGGVPEFSARFVGFAAAGATTQVVATMLLIYLFKLRNFAIGSMLIRIDILMTALIGAVFFSETLTTWGVAALVVVVGGVVLMSVGRIGTAAIGADDATLRAALLSWPTQVALACALLFSLSYLLMREATLVLLPGDFLWRAAWTMVTATGLQVVVVGIWLARSEPGLLGQLWANRRISGFIGLTSAAGSIGWFNAFALQNASYVRGVAQIEIVFTLLISWLYFRERLTGLEYAGIVVTICGVVMFRSLHS